MDEDHKYMFFQLILLSWPLYFYILCFSRVLLNNIYINSTIYCWIPPVVYKSIFKYYIMLTSFTGSSKFKLFVFAVLLQSPSSPVSVVNKIWSCREGGLGSRGWDSPALQGKGMSWDAYTATFPPVESGACGSASPALRAQQRSWGGDSVCEHQFWKCRSTEIQTG